MSKWNRPMRRFRSWTLVCEQCGQPVQPSPFGGWSHVQRIKVTDPAWHYASVKGAVQL